MYNKYYSDFDYKVYRFELTKEQKFKLEHTLYSMMGVKYDWKGVLGWMFNANTHGKFYCFEATLHILNEIGLIETDLLTKKVAISATDIINEIEKVKKVNGKERS
jgi:hypothetical protein